jgi:hypothetical protein
MLPRTVLFVSVTVPPNFAMPPPSKEALLPLTVLLMRVSAPRWLAMPPPLPLVVLSLTLLLMSVTVPVSNSLAMPPPEATNWWTEVLLLTVLLRFAGGPFYRWACPLAHGQRKTCRVSPRPETGISGSGWRDLGSA